LSHAASDWKNPSARNHPPQSPRECSGVAAGDLWLERIGNAVACVAALQVAAMGSDWWCLQEWQAERRFGQLAFSLERNEDGRDTVTAP
jgi:hypothetical protein